MGNPFHGYIIKDKIMVNQAKCSSAQAVAAYGFFGMPICRKCTVCFKTKRGFTHISDLTIQFYSDKWKRIADMLAYRLVRFPPRNAHRMGKVKTFLARIDSCRRLREMKWLFEERTTWQDYFFNPSSCITNMCMSGSHTNTFYTI